VHVLKGVTRGKRGTCSCHKPVNVHCFRLAVPPNTTHDLYCQKEFTAAQKWKFIYYLSVCGGVPVGIEQDKPIRAYDIKKSYHVAVLTVLILSLPIKFSPTPPAFADKRKTCEEQHQLTKNLQFRMKSGLLTLATVVVQELNLLT
jgi:hypothetical protein